MPAPLLKGFEHRVVVGVADMAVSNNPAVTLCTYSLGSCLGIAIYDPVVRVGGLIHLMLPDSSIAPEKAAARPAMFADTGVPLLFRAAYQMRAEKHRLKICVVGGAQIMDESGHFNIGRRNCEALDGLLRQNNLRVSAEQTGGMVNRTLYLALADGTVRLKVSGQTTETRLC